MYFTGIVLVLLSFISSACSQSTIYDGSNQGYTSVPSMPTDTSKAILSYNRIAHILPYTFAAYPNLTEIDLRFNSIASLSPEAFTGSVCEFLQLKGNSLKQFPDLSTLNGTLKRLGLISNDINYIDPLLAAPLTNLKGLWIGNNNLTTLDGLKVLSSLDSFGAMSNSITSIPVDIFSAFVSLEVLLLSGNPLSAMPDLLPLQPVASTLKTLELGISNQNNFFKEDLSKFNALTEFDISMLSLEDLYEFSNLTGLESLEMLTASYREIQYLPRTFFSELLHLKELTLQHSTIHLMEKVD